MAWQSTASRRIKRGPRSWSRRRARAAAPRARAARAGPRVRREVLKSRAAHRKVESMRITWFGHSCFRIDTDGSSILIDPFLTGNATFEEAGIPMHDVFKGVTHVALTHGHEDHASDAVRACKESGAQLLAVHELATYLAGRGVEKIDPGNTGGTLSHENFDLTFVPAW